MKVGIIIPDRNDRPEFLANCLRMIQGQSLTPTEIELVNDPAITNERDITWRYRIGYDRLRNKGLDVIAFIENDDWYSSDYLDVMTTEWVKNGKPPIFGTNYTIYYNIQQKAYCTMYHDTRSSAMSSLIVPNLDIKWCPDHEPYTDMHLWLNIKGGITFKPEKHICIGIKHGVGKCGGGYHTNKLDRYKDKDFDLKFLSSIVDPESLSFYKLFQK